MRVAHFVPRFSPVSETFIYDLVLAEQRLGVDVHVVTQGRELEHERPFHTVHVVGRSTFDPLRLAFRIGDVLGRRPAAQAGWTAMRLDLRRALARLRPDVVHAHFGPAGVIAAPVARALRLPLVVSFHGMDLSVLPRTPQWLSLYRELWPQACAVTVVSEWMRGRAVTLGCPQAKVSVVHVGCRVDGLSFRPRTDTPRRFISIGRLVEKKGHLDAIRAFEMALGSEDATFAVFGDGPLRDDLERYVRGRRLEHRVQFKGAAPHSEVLRALAESDAALVCSKTGSDGDEEGIPVVLMEAQSLGLPCVATRHAGMPEAIPSENHWLLSAEGDVAAIAAVIHKLRAQRPDELAAISQRGRQHIERHFDASKSVEAILRLYRIMASEDARREGAG